MKKRTAGKILCPDLSPIHSEYSNQFLEIRNRGGFYTLEFPEPQTVILPIVEHRAIILVRVFRPVIGDSPYELPAGGAKHGENVRLAARRELREETGIEIKNSSRFHLLPSVSEMPGRIPLLVNAFYVDITETEWKKRLPHDSEIHSVHLIPFEKIWEMIKDGTIYLSSPIAFLTQFLLRAGSLPTPNP